MATGDSDRWRWFWLIQALSLSRVVLVFAFIVISPFENARWIVLTVYLLAGATDFIDGRLARAKSLVSDLGRALDIFGDRYFSVISCLYVGIKGVNKIALAIIVLRELFSVALRMVQHDGKYVMAQNRMIGGGFHILIATGTSGFILYANGGNTPPIWFFVPFYLIAGFYSVYFPYSVYASWPAIKASVKANLDKPS